MKSSLDADKLLCLTFLCEKHVVTNLLPSHFAAEFSGPFQVRFQDLVWSVSYADLFD